jgi:hypothetical protein
MRGVIDKAWAALESAGNDLRHVSLEIESNQYDVNSAFSHECDTLSAHEIG